MKQPISDSCSGYLVQYIAIAVLNLPELVFCSIILKYHNCAWAKTIEIIYARMLIKSCVLPML